MSMQAFGMELWCGAFVTSNGRADAEDIHKKEEDTPTASGGVVSSTTNSFLP
jgi:hypothetical protein